MNKKRNSNIELLRILAMFFIVWHHCGYINSEALGNSLTYNTSIIKISYFLGKIGVNIFFLITGYFLCKGKFNKKKLLSIIATTEIYGLIVVIISILSDKINLGNSYIFYFPIVSSMFWFATDYIIIYLLSPYLNILIENLTKEKFKKFLITVLIIWCIIPNIFGIIGGTIGQIFEFTQLGWGIILYFVGAYFNIHGIKILKKQRNNIIILISSFILIILEIIIFTIFKEPLKEIQLVDMNHYINNANNVLLLVTAVTIFNIFVNMKYRYNAYINLIASAMFGVYLLHSNIVMDYIKKTVVEIPNKLIETNTPLLMTLSYTFDVMFVCCLIELFRLGILKITKKIIKNNKKRKKLHKNTWIYYQIVLI